MSARICRHLLIRGRVQGVCYRASAQEVALREGLGGWVRNRRDGTVEAVVEGPPAKVEAFVAWARVGPPAARVDAVEVLPWDEPGPSPFEFRPTL